MARIGHAAAGTNATGGTTCTITTTTALAAGDWLVGALTINPFPTTGAPTPPTVTLSDVPGNTYTVRQARQDATNNETIYLIDCHLTTGLSSGAAITATAGGTSYSRWAADFDKYQSIAYDISGNNAGSSITMNAGTVTVAGGYAIAGYGFGATHGSGTPSAGWTGNTPVTAGTGSVSGDRTVLVAYRTTSAGSLTGTALLSGTSSPYAAGIAAYVDVPVDHPVTISGSIAASATFTRTTDRSRTNAGAIAATGSQAHTSNRNKSLTGSVIRTGALSGIVHTETHAVALVGAIAATGLVPHTTNRSRVNNGLTSASATFARTTNRSRTVVGSIHRTATIDYAADHPTAVPQIDDLQDDFAYPALDESLWTTQAPTITTGTTGLHIPVAAGGAVAEVVSRQTSFRLGYSTAFLRVDGVPAGAPSNSGYAGLFLRNHGATTNSYEIAYCAGQLRAIWNLSGASHTVAQATYNAVTHKYWRIRHDAPAPGVPGTIYWETSPQGTVWTQLFAIGTGSAAGYWTNTEVSIAVGYDAPANPSSGSFIVGRFNTIAALNHGPGKLTDNYDAYPVAILPLGSEFGPYRTIDDGGVPASIAIAAGMDDQCLTITAPADAPDPVPVAFVGAASSPQTASSQTLTATIPAATAEGQVILLFFTTNTASAWTPPDELAEFTRLSTFNSGTTLVSTVYWKLAEPTDASTLLTWTLATYSKGIVDIAVYQGVDPARLTASAIAHSDGTVATHTSASLTAAADQWVLSYWADKTSTGSATTWTTPAGTTLRRQTSGTLTGRFDSIVVDSAAPVTAGPYGALVTTPSQPSDRWMSWTLALASSVVIASQVPYTAIAAFPGANVDFTVDVQAVSYTNGLASTDAETPYLCWRFTDPNTHYRLQLFRDYTRLCRVQLGLATEIARTGVGCVTGRTYRWRVSHVGGTIVVYRNAGIAGSVLCEFLRLPENVLAPPTGMIAFAASRSMATFDNLLVATAAATPPAEPSGTVLRERSWGATVIRPKGAAANLVPNAGFEAGTAGWSPAEAGTALSQSLTHAHTGTYALRMAHATGSSGYAAAGATMIGLTPGLAYTISAWCYSPTTTRAGLVGYSGTANYTTLTASTWTRSTLTVTATSDRMTIFVHGRNTDLTAPGNLYVDDVQFEQAAAATSWVDSTPELSPLDDITVITDLEARVGRKFSYACWTLENPQPFPATPALALAQGRDTVLSWGPAGWTLTDILAGVYDSQLATLKAALAALPGLVWFRLMGEPNSYAQPWSADFDPATAVTIAQRSTATANPAQYIAAWIYLKAKLTSANTRWVWTIAEDDAPSDNVAEDYFPGAANVDVLAFTAYNYGADGTNTWREYPTVVADPYHRLTGLSPTLPIWIAGIGSKEPTEADGAPSDGTHDKGFWTNAMMASQAYPRISAVMAYSAWRKRDYRMDSSSGALAAAHDGLSRPIGNYITVWDPDTGLFLPGEPKVWTGSVWLAGGQAKVWDGAAWQDVATPTAPPAPAVPQRFADFEVGTTAGFSFVQGTTVNASYAHTGSYGARIAGSLPAPGSNACLTWGTSGPFAVPSGHAWGAISLWFRYQTIPTVDFTNLFEIINTLVTSPKGQFTVFCDANAKLCMDLNPPDKVTIDPAMTTGVWHHIEARCFYGAAHYQVYIRYDGVVFPVNITALAQTTATVASLQIGYPSTNTTATVDVDEVALWVGDYDPGFLAV